MNDDRLFRQALQLQNGRAAGMQMPADMEQRVMSRLAPRRRHVRLAWWTTGIAAAACLLIAFLLGDRQRPQAQQPVLAEAVAAPSGMRAVRISGEQVVYIADTPCAPMPQGTSHADELRARGSRLMAEVDRHMQHSILPF